MAFWIAVGIDVIALAAVLVVLRRGELRLAETDESELAEEKVAA